MNAKHDLASEWYKRIKEKRIPSTEHGVLNSKL